jgi:hypothetical protein
MWRTLQRAAVSFSSPCRTDREPWAKAHGGTLKRAPQGMVVLKGTALGLTRARQHA